VPTDTVTESGTVTTNTTLNLRRGSPSTSAPLVRTVANNTQLQYVAYTKNGETVKNNSVWYQTQDGLWFWGGGVRQAADTQPLVMTIDDSKVGWWITDYGINDIWKESTGKGVKVAILDSGLSKCPDLEGVTPILSKLGLIHLIGQLIIKFGLLIRLFNCIPVMA